MGEPGLPGGGEPGASGESGGPPAASTIAGRGVGGRATGRVHVLGKLRLCGERVQSFGYVLHLRRDLLAISPELRKMI